MLRRLSVLIAAFLPLMSGAACAQAQTYPDKPVKLVVGFPPGGPTDIMARLFAQKLGEGFKGSFVVENKPGASTTIATDYVAKSKPDGYTILIATLAGQAVAPLIYPSLPYDSLKDFTAVTQLSSVPNLLATHSSVPAKNVRELVAMMQASPGKFNYASTGNGTSQHLAGELFKHMAKMDVVAIQYKGSAPALVDLLAGQGMSWMIDNTSSIGPHVRAGRLRGLAVTSLERVPAYSELPTMDEAGVPGYEVVSWFGLSVPAGTPKGVIDRLHEESVKFIRQPEVVKRLGELGATPVGSTPDQFGEKIRAELRKWAPIVKAAGIKVQ